MRTFIPLSLLLLLGSSACATPLRAEKRAVPLIEPGFVARSSADSWEALVREARPTCAWGGRDMLWVVVDNKSRPASFLLARAHVRRTADGVRWTILQQTRTDSSNPLGGDYLREETPVTEKSIGSDAGFFAHALRASSDPEGGTLYQIYWPAIFSGGSGNWQEGRWIFVLCDAKGGWQIIGEAPGEQNGKSGQYFSRRCTFEFTWTGKRDTPLRIDVTCINSQTEVGKEQLGLAQLDVRRDGVIQGALPAKLEWQGQEYVLAQKGQTVQSIAGDFSRWHTLGLRDRHEQIAKVQRVWRERLAAINTYAPDEPLKQDARVNVMSYSEFSKWLKRADDK